MHVTPLVLQLLQSPLWCPQRLLSFYGAIHIPTCSFWCPQGARSLSSCPKSLWFSRPFGLLLQFSSLLEKQEGNQHCCLSFCSNSAPLGGSLCPQSPSVSFPGLRFASWVTLKLFICLLVPFLQIPACFQWPSAPSISFCVCPLKPPRGIHLLSGVPPQSSPPICFDTLTSPPWVSTLRMHTRLLWFEGIYPTVRKVVSAVNCMVKNHVKNLLRCQQHVASGSRMLPWMQSSAVTLWSPSSYLAWTLLSLQTLTLEGREEDKERTNTTP